MKTILHCRLLIFYFSTSWDIEGQVEALKERCGFDDRVNDGVNWAYATSSMDVQSMAMVVAFLLVIGSSGYLIIYNIFIISVSQDIRYYGLLKTIGTTGRQLKKMVRRQAASLCLFGIPLGLFLGWLCGRWLMPTVMKSTTFAEGYVISVNPIIFFGAAAFAFVTVWISCIKPCAMAAKVSPVEAVRYTEGAQGKEKETRRQKKKNSSRKAETKRKQKKSDDKKTRKVCPQTMAFANIKRDRKKAILVILSLSLSMILLTGTYTIIHGFDMEIYLSDNVVTDFLLTDASARNFATGETVTDGVTKTVEEQIANLEGVTGSGNLYLTQSLHTLGQTAWDRALAIIKKNKAELPSPYADESIRMVKEDHQIYDNLYGLDEFLWDKIELANEKDFDREKFATGDYVITTAFWDDGEDSYYEPGDKVTLDFGNGNTKEYTVLALGEVPYALGIQSSFFLEMSFLLPKSEYTKQLGQTQPFSVGFDVTPSKRPAVQKWIDQYCEQVEPNLRYESRDVYIERFQNDQNMFLMVGGVLSVILGLIGVLNFGNAIVTSILARRREFAMLESVGMTGRQLKKMILWEGLTYAGSTVLFTLTLGNLLTYGGVQLLARDMWFFVYHFTMVSMLVCIPILLLVSVFIPVIAYHQITKQSVVERLRLAE